MLAFLAISFAAIAVNAQYGSNTANDAPSYQQPSYSNGPIYYPPVVYDSHFYWDYDSREHHAKSKQKMAPKNNWLFQGAHESRLTCQPFRDSQKQRSTHQSSATPSSTEDSPHSSSATETRRTSTFSSVSPRVRSVRYLYFPVRRNSTLDVRTAYTAAAGTSAGLVADCDRRDNRFIGPVINFNFTSLDFSVNVPVREVACIGLDKLPIVGTLTDKIVTAAGTGLAIGLNNGSLDIDDLFGRKKRDTAAEATTVAPAIVTDAAATVTEVAASGTTPELTSAEAAVASIDLSDGLSKEEAALIKDPKTAIKVGLAGIAKVLGSVF